MSKTKEKNANSLEGKIQKKFKSLEEKFEGSQEQLQKLQESGATKKQLKKAIAKIKKHGQALTEFIDGQQKNYQNSVIKQFNDFLIDKQDELKSIAKSKNGTIEFIPKAPEDITTGNGTDAETPQPNHNTQLGDFNLRNDNDLMSLMTVGQTSKAQASYTEMIPKDGNYVFVNEGNEKPQVDFTWQNRYPSPKKIAAYEILTEEAVTDVVRLMSIAKDYLKQKHDLFKVNACFFADGLNDNPTGATTYGRSFVAGDLALSVDKVQFMDIINACVTDIYTTQNFVDEAHYMPNTVMISPQDFFIHLTSAKDDNGLPLYPSAGLFSTVTIGGITIRPWVKIPSGKIFVADMKKYNVINYVPFSIRIGWINDQFITNKFTILGESRFFQYVKNLDQNAFIYDDIATIETAIQKV